MSRAPIRPSHINRYWLGFAPTLWPVFNPILTHGDKTLGEEADFKRTHYATIS